MYRTRRIRFLVLAGSLPLVFSCETPVETRQLPTLDPGAQLSATLAPLGRPDLTATAVSSTQIDLTWVDNSSAETEQRVQRNFGGTWKNIAILPPDVTSYSDTPLSASTTYQYRVRACGGGCETSWPAQATTLSGSTAPAAPTNASAMAASSVQLDLVWEDNATDETAYYVHRGSGGFTPTPDTRHSAALPAGTQAYADAGLTPSTAYHYRIEVVGPGGSSYSTEFSGTTNAAAGTAPTAPTELSATAVSSSRINLRWTDTSTNEHGFEIHRAPGATTDFALVDSIPADEIIYADTGLIASSSYQYRVRAFNTDGVSDWSNIAPTSTLAAPTQPLARPDLTATAVSSTRIDLTWVDNSAAETEQRVQRNFSGTWKNIAVLPPDVTSYSDTPLSPATTYQYRVRSCASACETSWPAQATTPSGSPAPAAPTNASATAASSVQLNLVWQDNATDETAYYVHRGSSGFTPSAGTRRSAALPAGTQAYADAGLTPSTAYYYRIEVVGPGGSSYSTEFSGTTNPSGPTPPPAPTNPSASAASTTQLNLSWTDNATNETAYYVHRGASGFTPSSATRRSSALPPGTVSYADVGLTAGTTYHYRIEVVGSGGSSYSVEFSGSTGAAGTPLARPTNLTGTAVSSTQINLTWVDNSSAETEQRVQRTFGGTWQNIAVLGPNFTSYSDTQLSPATTYQYRVRACNGACENSTSVQATTLSSAPAVSTMAPTAIADDGATLHGLVNPSGLATTAWFEYGTSSTLAGAQSTPANSVGSGAGSQPVNAVLSGLSSATIYYFRVVAQSSAGTTRGSILSFTTSAQASVRIVTFGDSNTDHGYSGTGPNPLVSSYISTRDATRLLDTSPNSPLQLAGKIEAHWATVRSNPLTAVNHGISSTTTGGGLGGGPERSTNAPNARTSVGGVTRFAAEVLGVGYPWSGGESGINYPEGAIIRTKAFTPSSADFVYVSMGTNDLFDSTMSSAQTLANLEWMVDQWVQAGRPASHFIMTTLAPAQGANPSKTVAVNVGIRDIAARRGIALIDLAFHTSANDGQTWRSASLHVGDGIHYSEAVRDWIALQVVQIMDGATTMSAVFTHAPRLAAVISSSGPS